MKEYLGDSVYITDTGFGIELTTENEPNEPSNVIVLEPIVLDNLIKFIKKIGY